MDKSQQIAGCVFISADDITSLLKQEPKEGKRELEPLKSFSRMMKVPLNILEDTRVVSEFEVHTQVGDLWHCIDGEVTFTLGGELIDPQRKIGKDGTPDQREIRAMSVRGGIENVLRAGDWLWIPPGVPHMHGADGTGRLYIIKVPS